jgi:perosamine synthetase
VHPLAIQGGPPVRTRPFPPYRPLGEEEKRAVMEVLDRGVLSQFLGAWSDDFYGGPSVRRLEREWASHFGVDHAVSMNSATSGLYAAVGAAGVGPGDEIIVSPYTMSASATAAIVYGAIPVFADIDPDIFCITPESIRARITPRTRAVIVVDLFGHPADMDEILQVARENHLVVIEDAAQAPGATYHNRPAGTLADMGVFSLNYHKTIHCGEGGVVVTRDARYADRLQLIRNHAEAVVKEKGTTDLVNMVGFNYRMTEIEAAIAREQLAKLEHLVTARVDAARHLDQALRGFRGITTPHVRKGVRHGYYLYVMRYDTDAVGIPRDLFVRAVRAEGIPVFAGYVEPLYLQPLYQKRIALGRDGFPFSNSGHPGGTRYDRGLCPVTERMHDREVFFTNVCHAGISGSDLDDVVRAIDKVLSRSRELAP